MRIIDSLVAKSAALFTDQNLGLQSLHLDLFAKLRQITCTSSLASLYEMERAILNFEETHDYKLNDHEIHLLFTDQVAIPNQKVYNLLQFVERFKPQDATPPVSSLFDPSAPGPGSSLILRAQRQAAESQRKMRQAAQQARSQAVESPRAGLSSLPPIVTQPLNLQSLSPPQREMAPPQRKMGSSERKMRAPDQTERKMTPPQRKTTPPQRKMASPDQDGGGKRHSIASSTTITDTEEEEMKSDDKKRKRLSIASSDTSVESPHLGLVNSPRSQQKYMKHALLANIEMPEPHCRNARLSTPVPPQNHSELMKLNRNSAHVVFEAEFLAKEGKRKEHRPTIIDTSDFDQFNEPTLITGTDGNLTEIRDGGQVFFCDSNSNPRASYKFEKVETKKCGPYGEVMWQVSKDGNTSLVSSLNFSKAPIPRM